MIEKVDVKSLNLKELEEFLLSLGEKKFRAKQIYEWMHIHHVTSFDEMTNLSLQLREKLKENYKDTLLGNYIEEMERRPQDVVTKKALEYGVNALLGYKICR